MIPDGQTAPPSNDIPGRALCLLATRVLSAAPIGKVVFTPLEHERPLYEKARCCFLQEQESFFLRLRERILAISSELPDFMYVEDPDGWTANLKVNNETLDVLIRALVGQASEKAIEQMTTVLRELVE